MPGYAEENHERMQKGWTVILPRFEPTTSQLKSRASRCSDVFGGKIVRFEVLITMTQKRTVIWDMIPESYCHLGHDSRSVLSSKI
jgi:hypothetical protein